MLCHIAISVWKSLSYKDNPKKELDFFNHWCLIFGSFRAYQEMAALFTCFSAGNLEVRHSLSDLEMSMFPTKSCYDKSIFLLNSCRPQKIIKKHMKVFEIWIDAAMGVRQVLLSRFANSKSQNSYGLLWQDHCTCQFRRYTKSCWSKNPLVYMRSTTGG